MKKIAILGIIAGIMMPNLYADSANTAPQTSGELTNYQAVLNIALAHKNEIFLSRVNILFNYISNYILKTGDININKDKLKQYFNIKNDLFKNFDGKNDMKITVDATGVYFQNIYDSTPSENELYFLQHAPNYPSLMKLYYKGEGANREYVLFMPFNPTVSNFYKITESLLSNTFVAPEKYKDIIKNAVISEKSPSISSSLKGSWLKPEKGTYVLYVNNGKGWQEVAIIENNGAIRPLENAIGETETQESADNIYSLNPQEIKDKVVVKSLSEVSVDKLKDGTIVIVNPNPDDKNSITTTYIKVGGTLQPLNKENLTQETKEIQRKIIGNYLNKNASIYLTFSENNFNKITQSFNPKGNFAFGSFKAKGIFFKEDPVTKQKFAFLVGGPDSYIRSTEAAKVFGYIQRLQKNKVGATVSIIVVFKNATPDIKNPLTGKPVYDEKTRQVPFGVSGRGIGLYYAYGNMCYGCYGGDYRYIAHALLPQRIGLNQSRQTNAQNILSTLKDWMIAVWEYKPGLNLFKLFKVHNGKAIKMFELINEDGGKLKELNIAYGDFFKYYDVRDKRQYNPSVDYLSFGGKMQLLGPSAGVDGGFDVYSPSIINNGIGFRGWIGNLTIIPSLLDDKKIIDIVKYQMPNLIK